MYQSSKKEKIKSSKRLAWNEEEGQRKSDKRNKTRRDNTDKRSWMETA